MRNKTKQAKESAKRAQCGLTRGDAPASPDVTSGYATSLAENDPPVVAKLIAVVQGANRLVGAPETIGPIAAEIADELDEANE